MTKTIIKGKIAFICDECSNGLETDTNNWDAAKEILRGEAWQTYKDDNEEWCHRCSDCADARDPRIKG